MSQCMAPPVGKDLVSRHRSAQKIFGRLREQIHRQTPPGAAVAVVRECHPDPCRVSAVGDGTSLRTAVRDRQHTTRATVARVPYLPTRIYGRQELNHALSRTAACWPEYHPESAEYLACQDDMTIDKDVLRHVPID